RLLFIRFRESGTLRASVANVQFSIILNMQTFRTTYCYDSIGSFNVALKGKLLAWIVRTFVNVDKLLKRKHKGQICKAVSKAINKQSSRISRIIQG
ncbi:Hypothetical predicted protein, partial [Mytilus galloprovincialis]